MSFFVWKLICSAGFRTHRQYFGRWGRKIENSNTFRQNVGLKVKLLSTRGSFVLPSMQAFLRNKRTDPKRNIETNKNNTGVSSVHNSTSFSKRSSPRDFEKREQKRRGWKLPILIWRTETCMYFFCVKVNMQGEFRIQGQNCKRWWKKPKNKHFHYGLYAWECSG